MAVDDKTKAEIEADMAAEDEQAKKPGTKPKANQLATDDDSGHFGDCDACAGTGLYEGLPDTSDLCTKCHGSGKVLH